jgi:phosphoglycolate phosphatase
MRLKLVIFDYNGLLVDDLKIHQRCFEQLARKYNPDITSKEIKDMMSSPTKKKIKTIMGSASEETLERVLKEKEDIYIDIIKGKNIFFPGAKETIIKLSQKYKLAIISNTTKKQLIAAVPEQILKKFARIITYEEIEKPKPAPDSLLKLMETLSVKPEECCYIGDSLIDIETARNAGIAGIGIPSGFDSKEELINAGADKVIDNIRELPDVLQTIL